jgi:hypothetical protein
MKLDYTIKGIDKVFTSVIFIEEKNKQNQKHFTEEIHLYVKIIFILHSVSSGLFLRESKDSLR